MSTRFRKLSTAPTRTRITIDTPRPWRESNFRTRDGLDVRVELLHDTQAAASYPGTWLRELDDLCPGLFPDDEPFEMPLYQHDVYARPPVRRLEMKPRMLRRLIDGEQRTRTPRAVLVRMYALEVDKRNVALNYDLECTNGAYKVRCTVTKDGQRLVSHDISGLCRLDDSRVISRCLVADTLEEARTMLDGL